jgi:hypothetical protein
VLEQEGMSMKKQPIDHWIILESRARKENC